MTTTDSRTRLRRIADAVLNFVDDQRPVREVTARKRAHHAFVLGVDAGEAGYADRIVRTPR
ncbi:hypothetical protein [Nocardioides sp.]|uniref:hypothetical protein n=1 Tax=Nocardioides sp. TaxID=35761 RepID=UPI002B27629D|nr:hypothetical protein [Nocardioides sp.]